MLLQGNERCKEKYQSIIQAAGVGYNEVTKGIEYFIFKKERES
jgi:hypothetical protein